MKPLNKNKKLNLKDLIDNKNSNSNLLNNQTTQATTVSALTRLLKNKGSLSNITNDPSSLKSQSHNIKQKKKFNSATKALIYSNRKSIVSVKDNKIKNNNQQISSLLPTNINSYLHLIRDVDFSQYENLNWTLRLRDYSHQNSLSTKITNYTDFYTRKENTQKTEPNYKNQKKIKLTEHFEPPSFYEDDLQKYKNSIKKKKRPMSLMLNPNYAKIRHLISGKNYGQINFSQLQFSSTLGNFYTRDEHKKKWEILPVVKNDKHIAKFLLPRTQSGINNFRRVEKFTHKNFDILFDDATLGDEKFKKKILNFKNEYTYSGIGETIGDQKYDNIFREKKLFL